MWQLWDLGRVKLKSVNQLVFDLFRHLNIVQCCLKRFPLIDDSPRMQELFYFQLGCYRDLAATSNEHFATFYKVSLTGLICRFVVECVERC